MEAIYLWPPWLTGSNHPKNGITGIDVVYNCARKLAALESIGLRSRAENGPETRKARKTA
jgi:hypothetical protein